MPTSELNIAGKDYLTIPEAAHYCCVSVSQFRKLAPRIGVFPFEFMGKVVYRKADLRLAMESAANRQIENVSTASLT